MMKGKVYLVGAGPGNPKLLTVRALEVFQEVDVVLYDRLVSKEILELIPASVTMTDVGKASHGSAGSQEEINRIMVMEANNGNNVLRLKGGDPMLFSRGGEEIEALRSEDIDYEVVPGVSSATGISSYIGLPLTHRKLSSSVTIVTGHEDPSKPEPSVDFGRLASVVDTLVILMGTEKLHQIAEKLVNAGTPLSRPVAIVENGTRSDQRLTFSSLQKILDGETKLEVSSPALIVVGDVVRLANGFPEIQEDPDRFSDALQKELMESKTWCAAAEYS